MLKVLAQNANKIKFLLDHHSPTLLSGAGVAGTIATAYLTGRASFKAAHIIAEETDVKNEVIRTDPMMENHHGSYGELSRTQKAKLVWKEFIPPAASGVLTITSIIAANKITSKRLAALTVAAGVSERALTEYKEKVLEKLGERQEQKIRDEVAQDRVTGNPSSQPIVIGDGEVLCYDMLTGRYFKSSMEKIRAAENKVNYELVHYMSCSLSFFYEEIGLAPTSYTDSVGWNAGNRIEVQFTTTLSDDGRPCIAIDFSKPPILDYEKHWDT